MNTELTFLMELFLEDEMPKEFKQKIKERIKEVEVSLTTIPMGGQHAILSAQHQTAAFNRGINEMAQNYAANQAPSMQRIMEANPDLVVPRGPVVQAPQPVTPAAAQALAARAKLIHNSLNEKPEEGRKSPRKF